VPTEPLQGAPSRGGQVSLLPLRGLPARPVSILCPSDAEMRADTLPFERLKARTRRLRCELSITTVLAEIPL
jgi:hypothetical protein